MALLALLLVGVAAADREGSDIFPQDISTMFQPKGGYTHDRMAEEGLFLGSARANFYMAGQWVHMRGGVPGAIMSGRHLMQMICKKDAKKFQTSTP